MWQKTKDFFGRRQGLLALWMLAFWPFANFINHNKKLLRMDEVGLVLCTYVALAVLVTLVANIFFCIARIKQKKIWYVLFGTMLLLFFSYDGVIRAIHLAIENFPSLPIGVNTIYAGLCVFLLATMVVFVGKLHHGLTIVKVFAATAILIPMTGFVTFSLEQMAIIEKHSVDEASEQGVFTTRPNVYYFMTDEYARNDQIMHVTGYDNSAYTNMLEANGFFVSKHSYSNYPVTFLSLAASLSMSYPYRDSENVTNREYAHRIIGGDNPVVKHFRKNGYFYFHAPAVLWNGSRCAGFEDVCIRPSSFIGNEVTTNLLRMTPLLKVLQKYSLNISYIATFDNMMAGLEHVRNHTPFFLFFHNLSPHPPQIFRPDCSLKIDASIKLSDTTTPGAKEETPAGFLDNLKCVNNQVERTISKIRQVDPESIIILHADHGTPFSIDWEKDPREWTTEQLQERFAIQMAIHLPERCKQDVYDGISPVNVFEAVFACLEGRNPDFKPDESYGFLYERVTQEEQKVWKVNIPRN